MPGRYSCLNVTLAKSEIEGASLVVVDSLHPRSPLQIHAVGTLLLILESLLELAFFGLTVSHRPLSFSSDEGGRRKCKQRGR